MPTKKENNASHDAGDEIRKKGVESGMSRINQDQSISDSGVEIRGDPSSK